MRTISLIPVSDNVFNYANYQIVHNSDRWSWSQLCQCKCQVRWYLQMMKWSFSSEMIVTCGGFPTAGMSQPCGKQWHLIIFDTDDEEDSRFIVLYEYFQWYKDDNVMWGRVTLNLPTCTFYPWTQPTRLWHLNSFWWFNGTLFFWMTTVIFINILLKQMLDV